MGYHKERRKKHSEIISKVMGGECIICGYDRCTRSLHIHHIDADTKDFTVSSAVHENNKKLNEIIKELQKCVLVCANCHGEIHYGFIDSPQESSFDYEAYDSLIKFCANPYCESKIDPLEKKETCCSKCCSKVRGMRSHYPFLTLNEIKEAQLYKKASKLVRKYKPKKTRWATIDVIDLLERNSWNFSAAGRELGISDNAVRKRYKRVCAGEGEPGLSVKQLER